MSENEYEPLTARVLTLFRERYDRAPTAIAFAPGRINLIGEHVDYNEGLVLPMAIQRYTAIGGCITPDASRIEIYTETLKETGSLCVEDYQPAKSDPAWLRYVGGVITEFANGRPTLPAFQAVVTSTVPLGGGLSSSASLEVATASLLERLTGHHLPPVEKALLCQRAEHRYAGVPCGIMDQFASVFGKRDHALMIDCRTMSVEPIPFNDPDVSVLVVDSRIKHRLANGQYAVRRSECEEAKKRLHVDSLRDVSVADLLSSRSSLPEHLFRRAKHVVTEIERTRHMANCLRAGEWNAAGELLLQSHESLRADYEVSCPELDLLVDLLKRHDDDVFGTRMTGGGFGGCTISLVRTGSIQRISPEVAQSYHAATGITPTIFATRPADGASSFSFNAKGQIIPNL